MFTNEEPNEIFVSLKKFENEEGKPVQKFETRDGKQFNTVIAKISSIGQKPAEHGMMFYIELENEDDPERPIIVWIPEREWCSLASRLLSEKVNAHAPVKLKPYYFGKGKARGISVYQSSPNSGNWEKIEAVKSDEIKDMPEWKKSGDYYDSSQQATWLFEKLLSSYAMHKMSQ